MPVSIELPEKCRECRKFNRQISHGRCAFCQKLGFQEAILCDLNRRAQYPKNFECFAFTPMLKSVGSTKQAESFVSNESTRPFQTFLKSDRYKYQRALAVQKLKDDPDAVLINIRYHFAWNVIHRRSSFSEPQEIFKTINEALFECGLSISSFVSLLWLAPDHLHIYVESDGEKSVETLAQEIKRLSESYILAKGIEKTPNMSNSNDLWDNAYFAETIG